MTSPAPSVAVVVPTHNRVARLPRLFRALEQQTVSPEQFELVVVDDGSADATAETLRRLVADSPLRARVITVVRSAGPAVARNLGWRATGADLLAFTDDDCVPEPGWLAAGVDAMGRDAAVGVLQGRTVPDDEGERRTWSTTREVVGPSPFFEGCNLVVRRAALEGAGGFDERLGMGCEDAALGWEVLAQGWTRAFAADAVVRHDITDPGPGWHVRQGLMQTNIVAVAKRYPEMRREFWRPWALGPRTAAFAAAVAGVAVGAVWRPAIVLAGPYAWMNRPCRPAEVWLKRTVAMGVMDSAAFAGMVRGCVRHGILVV